MSVQAHFTKYDEIAFLCNSFLLKRPVHIFHALQTPLLRSSNSTVAFLNLHSKKKVSNKTIATDANSQEKLGSLS